MTKKYTNTEIDAIIDEISENFNSACQLYKLALSARDSNRSNKELLRGNTKGTTIHKYQCQIAWVLHDIKCGPICFIEDNIIEANNIISHLRSIASV